MKADEACFAREPPLRLRDRRRMWCFRPRPKPITLSDLKASEDRILMDLNKVKTQIAAAAARSTEAFAEVSSRIAALEAEVQALIDGATNPDITEETFLADLNTLQTNIESLADIVPTPPDNSDPLVREKRVGRGDRP